MKYTRKLIDVEIRLGFLYIPSKGQKVLPNENTKLKVTFGDTTKSLNYNSEYNRVFGLTSWYRKKKLEVGSILEVSIEGEAIQINLVSIKPTLESKSIVIEEKIVDSQPVIDTSNLSSGAKGNIVEDRIKELILLYGQGMLNVYKPVIDNEGIDLIALKNGQFHSIFLQVKSRYNAYESQKLVLTISRTFKPHNSFYIVGVSFNASKMEVENKILFVPSKVVAEKGTKLSDGKIRITASLKDSSNDLWQPYMVTKEEMIGKLISQFAEMEKYYK